MSAIFQSYKKYIFCLLYGIIIIVINNLIHASFTGLLCYSDGCFIAGLSLLCFGGLSIVNNLGAFDIFSYMFVKKDEHGFKKPFFDYCEGKKESRSKKKYASIPYFITGFFYIILSIIFVIILN